mmetsp:Transcript_83861/g.234005  ORF Transcript_83861/g.234005 Transcript_83861/m.234005 type:complete len:844 (-) Transcript_83861:81-2612(-)
MDSNLIRKSSVLGAVSLEVENFRSLARTVGDPDSTSVSESEDSQCRMGTHPLLYPEKIQIDDQGVDIVLVFPRDTSEEAPDATRIVKRPWERCQQLFRKDLDEVEECQPARKTGEGGGLSALRRGPVTEEQYQDTVRQAILDVFHRKSGLRVVAADSYDGDEVFVKLSLDTHSDVAGKLARRYMYRLPIRKSAMTQDSSPRSWDDGDHSSEDMDEESEYPKVNAESREVPVFVPFNREYRSAFEDFRNVDAIRLAEHRLAEWMDFPQLQMQSVITQRFAAAKYHMVMQLEENWSSLRHICCLPSEPDEVREYFGERVAFFFLWASFNTRMLTSLVVVAIFVAVSRLWSQTGYARMRGVFSAIMVLWAAIFNKVFKRRAQRRQQQWGTKDIDFIQRDRAAYDPDLENTWALTFRKGLTIVIALLFCAAFIGVNVWLEVHKAARARERDSSHHNWAWLQNTVLIKGGSFLWGIMARRLVDLQNHRTWARWEDSLTWTLISVKLFVALFPFLVIAFAKRWSELSCAADIAEAAGLVYGYRADGSLDTPWGLEIPGPDDYSWLEGHYFSYRNYTCIDGCYPAYCARGTLPSDVEGCTSICILDLQTSLCSVLLTHVGTSIVFIIIPIVMTRGQVWREMARSKEFQRREDYDLPPYSFLQLQAKCPVYEYYSWGGSLVEDFLELAVSFALFVSFGVVLPEITIVLFLVRFVEYRLLAHRMTAVVCRPWPRPGDGIGEWQGVFEMICNFGILCNVVLLVFTMNPMCQWRKKNQLIAVIVMEHALLLFKVGIDFALGSAPHDVRTIEDFNARVQASLRDDQHLAIKEEDMHSINEVDVSFCGCNPSGDGL